jgi:hypothetical protein
MRDNFAKSVEKTGKIHQTCTKHTPKSGRKKNLTTDYDYDYTDYMITMIRATDFERRLLR